VNKAECCEKCGEIGETRAVVATSKDYELLQTNFSLCAECRRILLDRCHATVKATIAAFEAGPKYTLKAVLEESPEAPETPEGALVEQTQDWGEVKFVELPPAKPNEE
jgi:hypothetical protein